MAANHVNVSWSIMMFLLSYEPPQRFAVPVLALTGATSYWASVVASPPGHMSGSGARGTGDLWQLPAGWPARSIYANRPSGVCVVQGDLWIDHRPSGRMVRGGKVRNRSR